MCIGMEILSENRLRRRSCVTKGRTFALYMYLDDTTVSPDFSFNKRDNIRGYYKLHNQLFQLSLWFTKVFFSACVANTWNSLPNSVVDACTVNAFKARLDKFWPVGLKTADQPVQQSIW